MFKLDRSTIISIACVILSLALIFMVLFGCKCTKEGFETEPKPEENPESAPESKSEDSKKPDEFTAKEQELFQDLVNNKVSDSDIQKLIANGVLTDKLVESFLEKLGDGPSGPAGPSTSPAKKNVVPPAMPSPSQVESFVGGAEYAAF